MVHLPDASLADGAVMGSFWLYGAALLTLVEDLTLRETQLFDGLLRGCPTWDGSWVSEHGAQVGTAGQESEELEEDQVNNLVDQVLLREEDAGEDHVLGEEDEAPGEHGADESTHIFHEPDPSAQTTIMRVYHRQPPFSRVP